MTIVLRIARGVADHFPARASEWALGAMLTGWGLVLSQPAETMATRSYQGLAIVWPEWVWAALCLMVGFARLTALTINGTFKDTRYSRWSPHVRGAMAFLSGFFWLQITLSFWPVRPFGTGIAIYPVLLALDAYNFARCMSDARQSDEAARAGGV